MAFHWWSGDLWRKKFEEWREENGLYDVGVLHPNTTGIENCTSATALFVFLFFLFLSHCRVVIHHFVCACACVCEKTQNAAILNIYFSIPQRTHTEGEKKLLSYFGSVLFYSSF